MYMRPTTAPTAQWQWAAPATTPLSPRRAEKGASSSLYKVQDALSLVGERARASRGVMRFVQAFRTCDMQQSSHASINYSTAFSGGKKKSFHVFVQSRSEQFAPLLQAASDQLWARSCAPASGEGSASVGCWSSWSLGKSSTGSSITTASRTELRPGHKKMQPKRIRVSTAVVWGAQALRMVCLHAAYTMPLHS